MGMATGTSPKPEPAPWGILTSIDLYECDGEIIRDGEKIKDYVIRLCRLIKMTRFGECQVVHFGEDKRVEGYSMVQLIETSLISGHFANATNRAYIDIFSCGFYDPDEAAEFTREFFKAESVGLNVLKRM
jgi:S-adenosylmethionine decarboxylase